ncbi:HAD hydrolase family protein [Eubacteriales bacterium OttesenSCG-928-M02]|nr:HAD hydrolase family protein [Eubacteriales bacterium OttesenSCG-928-M02]
MGRIRMIATDLDGTYMPNLVELVEENIKAVGEAKKAGIKVVPCTGRHWGFARYALASANFDGLCITSNGAAIRDTQTGEDKRVHLIDPARLPAVVQYLSGRGKVIASTRDSFFVHSPEQEAFLVVEESYPINSPYGIRRASYRDWETMLEACNSQVERLVYRVEDTGLDAICTVQEALASILPLEVTSPFPGAMELMAKGCTKANGVKEVAELYGIPREAVLAIGDNINDMSMVTWAGVGVAVDSGQDELKQVADIVAPGCIDGGLAKIIYDCIDGKI